MIYVERLGDVCRESSRVERAHRCTCVAHEHAKPQPPMMVRRFPANMPPARTHTEGQFNEEHTFLIVDKWTEDTTCFLWKLEEES